MSEIFYLSDTHYKMPGLIRPMSHEAVVVKKRSWMSSESCPDSESQQSNKDEQKY